MSSPFELDIASILTLSLFFFTLRLTTTSPRPPVWKNQSLHLTHFAVSQSGSGMYIARLFKERQLLGDTIFSNFYNKWRLAQLLLFQ